MKWILIVSAIHINLATIEFQEFNSEEACRQAAGHFQQIRMDHVRTACVPDKIEPEEEIHVEEDEDEEVIPE